MKCSVRCMIFSARSKIKGKGEYIKICQIVVNIIFDSNEINYSMTSLNGAVDVSFPKMNHEKNPRSFVIEGQSIIFVTVSYMGSSYNGLQILTSPLLLKIKPTNAADQSAKLVNLIALTQLKKKLMYAIA